MWKPSLLTSRLRWLAIVLSVLMALPSAPASARRLPDLIVSHADFRATGACDGAKAIIMGVVHIKNIANARAQIFTTRDMIRARVRGVPGLEAGVKFVNSMRPGDVQRVDVSIGGNRQHKISGLVTVDIEVDPMNVFEEANEANNKASVQVRLDCK